MIAIHNLVKKYGEPDPQTAGLAGVVHTAGVLDDGVITSLTAERMRTVLAPKADAAWHLHELTQDLELSLFAVCSSAAGILASSLKVFRSNITTD